MKKLSELFQNSPVWAYVLIRILIGVVVMAVIIGLLYWLDMQPRYGKAMKGLVLILAALIWFCQKIYHVFLKNKEE